ncbi:MAG: hypothetical protein WCP74_01955 [Sphingobacteriia bacterium]|jgi:hypothetical protein
MKKKILYSVLGVIVIAAIWVAFNREKATQMVVDLGMSMTSSMKHRDPSSEKAKFEMTAEALTKEFKDNPTQANAKFINQAVLIEGIVTEITGVTVSMNNIACNIDSSNIVKIQQIKKGDKIKVQGLVVGYNDLMEEIPMAQCKIKE